MKEETKTIITEIMNEDAKDGLYREDDVHDLARKFAQEESYAGHGMNELFKGFIFGFKKAEKILYTEEDIDKLLSFYTDDAPASYIKKDYKKYLHSIKKP